MKPLMSFFLIFLFASGMTMAQSKAVNKFFDKYAEDERFTMVYFSPKMFEMMSKIELDDVEDDVMDVIRDLKGLRILASEHAEAPKLAEEAHKTINTKSYDVLMKVREDDNNVQILVKDEGDIVNELLLLVDGSDEFVIMSFEGNIDLKKVGKLAKLINFSHAKHLEKIEER